MYRKRNNVSWKKSSVAFNEPFYTHPAFSCHLYTAWQPKRT
uniref:Transposase n=1 Tax=Heterorhabditis bacteriophora TaxID=37862 RepID=A0A1I7X784_HETBA